MGVLKERNMTVNAAGKSEECFSVEQDKGNTYSDVMPLWSEVSRKIAREYAKEFHEDLVAVFQKTLFAPCDQMLERIDLRFTLKDILSEDETLEEKIEALDITLEKIGEAFDVCMEKCDELMEKMEETYHVRTKPLVELCCAYGIGAGYGIEQYDPFDFLPDSFMDIDVDMVIERSKLGKAIKEIEELDNAKGFRLIVQFGKMAKAVISIKELVEDAFKNIKEEIYQSIPSSEEIEKAVYDGFMTGL
ncbi:MAG: hypothetical protein NC416_16230 [Eubacterium sp.]|nr:hypothetical protein [Eubacterium sp.]